MLVLKKHCSNFRMFSITKSNVLAEKLRKNQEELMKNLWIIDVREKENYEKNHIKSAVNMDSRDLMKWSLRDFNEKLLPSVIAKARTKAKAGDDHVDVEMFFHCHMSLIRGPSSAAHIEDLLKRSRILDEVNIKIHVHLIEGGWKGWKREYPDLIE